jgi:hypothetical protein
LLLFFLNTIRQIHLFPVSLIIPHHPSSPIPPLHQKVLLLIYSGFPATKMSSPNPVSFNGLLPDDAAPDSSPNVSVDKGPLYLLWVHELKRQNEILSKDLKSANNRLDCANKEVDSLRTCLSHVTLAVLKSTLRQNGRTLRAYFNSANAFRIWQSTLSLQLEYQCTDRFYIDAFVLGMDNEAQRLYFDQRGPWEWDAIRTYILSLGVEQLAI